MLLCFCPDSTLNLFPLKSGESRFGLPGMAGDHIGTIVGPDNGQSWRSKSSPNYTAMLPMKTNRAEAPLRRSGRVRSVACGVGRAGAGGSPGRGEGVSGGWGGGGGGRGWGGGGGGGGPGQNPPPPPRRRT